MQKITLEKRKKLQFDILCDVHDFCVRNNIIYFLSSGTLIGAIRHQGYIPWDDDIDIAMPRKDYDHFFQSYSSQYYKALNFNIDIHWPYAFGKVCDTRTLLMEKYVKYPDLGVCIDVFPIDGLPQNKFIRRVHLNQIFITKYLIGQKHFPPRDSPNWFKAIYHTILRCIVSPFSVSRIMGLQDKLIRKYAWEASSDVASLSSKIERIPCDKSCFAHLVDKTFEKRLFNVPCGYDIWLRLIYGDYLKLPPVEKQIAQHDFIAYWKNDLPLCE